MAQQISTNTFGVAKWIVSADATQGTHTTITAAMASASSGDTIFVRDGSYTENFTLKAGVTVNALSDSGDTPNVTIIGKITFTAAGEATICGVRLQTNSDFCVVVSGSNACILNITDCDIRVSNNTAISFTNSNASSTIYFFECYGDITTTGIALFASSSAGSLQFDYSRFTNTGASTTASTASAGQLKMYYSYFFSPISTSGTNSRNSTHSKYSTGTQNVTAVTIGTGAGSSCDHDIYDSGSASSISVAGSESVYNSIINSSNTNVITGAGSISIGNIDFPTNNKINTTTQTYVVGSRFGKVVRQVFAATGTYTPTSGMKYCDIEVVGAGGGGGAISAPGATAAGAAGGGGGGGYAKGIFSAATIGASQAVTIGAAGIAGTAAGTGGTGGTTSVGSLISATGGVGGVGVNSQANGTTAAGGAGGAGSNGDFQTTGTPGGNGIAANGAAGFPSGAAGNGGSSYFGGAGRGAANLNGAGGTTGGTGLSYGGGGGGAAGSSSSGAANGGAGFAGVVIVTEYI